MTDSTDAELLLPDDLCDFGAVSELEEPLDRLLIDAGAGEVMGGGIGSGWYRFDLVVRDYEALTNLLKTRGEELGLPPGSCLRRKGEVEATLLIAPE